MHLLFLRSLIIFSECFICQVPVRQETFKRGTNIHEHYVNVIFFFFKLKTENKGNFNTELFGAYRRDEESHSYS